jgi:hypothetical protein
LVVTKREDAGMRLVESEWDIAKYVFGLYCNCWRSKVQSSAFSSTLTLEY